MHIPWPLLLTYSIVGWCIRAGMVPVVLRRQFAPGASLAWLGIVFLHPYIGLVLYLLVGESRLGPYRVEHYRKIIAKSRIKGADGVMDAPHMQEEIRPMVLQAEKISGMPVLQGNGVEFIPDAEQFFTRLVGDIDSAKKSVDLLYFIIACDATARRIVDAVCRAAGRGVRCRVLADAVASRGFLRRSSLLKELRGAGVEVAAALPVELIRRRLPRMDLRNHRKLAVIDGVIGYCGSHNLINADYGGKRGGPWYDLTGRFVGPVVDELAIVFDEDWSFETEKPFAGPSAYDTSRCAGDCLMQVAPTGPSAPGDTYRRLLLAAVQCSRQKLMLTTPYFVPDEPTLVALMMAADRGVEVDLLLPRQGDNLFAAAAARAHFTRLMDAGISIYQYRPGLLHAKTTTVDDAFCMFGSANLDVRSFNLNFELNVLLYGAEITQRLRAVQQAYLSDCDRIDPKAWANRPVVRSYADGAVALFSPLL
jgi:cardiolipin synthase